MSLTCRKEVLQRTKEHFPLLYQSKIYSHCEQQSSFNTITLIWTLQSFKLDLGRHFLLYNLLFGVWCNVNSII